MTREPSPSRDGHRPARFPAQAARQMDTRAILLTAGMYLIFTTTWIGAKYGLQSFPPLTLGFIRNALAASLLLALCYRGGLTFPRHPRSILLAVGLGFFTGAVPASLGFWGLSNTQASLASVILATQPFFTVLLAHYFLASEPLTRRRVLGLAIGFAGVGVISFDKSSPNDYGNLLGQLALVATSLAVAISAVWGKNTSRTWQVLPLTAVQTTGAALFVLCGVLALERGAPLDITPLGVAAAVYLAVGPTVVGYGLWVYLIDRYSAGGVASFAFSQPAFGVILGWLLFAESFTAVTVLGLALVAWSVIAVNRSR